MTLFLQAAREKKLSSLNHQQRRRRKSKNLSERKSASELHLIECIADEKKKNKRVIFILLHKH